MDRSTPEAPPVASAAPGTEVVEKPKAKPFSLLDSVQDADGKWKGQLRLKEVPVFADFVAEECLALKRNDFSKMDCYFDHVANCQEAAATASRAKAEEIRQNGGKTADAKKKRLDSMLGGIGDIAAQLGISQEDLAEMLAKKAA